MSDASDKAVTVMLPDPDKWGDYDLPNGNVQWEREAKPKKSAEILTAKNSVHTKGSDRRRNTAATVRSPGREEWTAAFSNNRRRKPTARPSRSRRRRS